VSDKVDVSAFLARTALLAGLVVWSVVLVRMDFRTGGLGQSFLHRPLLVFHAAGHAVFMVFGPASLLRRQWSRVAGDVLHENRPGRQPPGVNERRPTPAWSR